MFYKSKINIVVSREESGYYTSLQNFPEDVQDTIFIWYKSYLDNYIDDFNGNNNDNVIKMLKINSTTDDIYEISLEFQGNDNIVYRIIKEISDPALDLYPIIRIKCNKLWYYFKIEYVESNIQ